MKNSKKFNQISLVLFSLMASSLLFQNCAAYKAPPTSPQVISPDQPTK